MDGTANEYWLSNTVANVNTGTTSVTLMGCASADDWTPAAGKYLTGWGLSSSGTGSNHTCYMFITTGGNLSASIVQSNSTV